jgi:hypothetical protein
VVGEEGSADAGDRLGRRHRRQHRIVIEDGDVRH